MILPDVQQGSAQWHDLRARGIGGSESAAFFKAEKRTFQLSLWGLYQVKSGNMRAVDIAGERAVEGIEMEPAILAAICRREGLNVQRGGYVISDEDERIRHSPDAIAEDVPRGKRRDWPDMIGKPGMVEIKMVSGDALYEEWGWNKAEPERPHPPRRHMIQLQHGMLAAGLEWGVLGVMIKGALFPAYYTRRDEAIIDGIRAGVADLYRRIAFGDEPPIDGHDTTAAIVKNHYRRASEKHLVMRGVDEANEAAGAFLANAANKRFYEVAYSQTDNALRNMLGPYETAETDDWMISIKPNKNGKRTTTRVTERKGSGT